MKVIRCPACGHSFMESEERKVSKQSMGESVVFSNDVTSYSNIENQERKEHDIRAFIASAKKPLAPSQGYSNLKSHLEGIEHAENIKGKPGLCRRLTTLTNKLVRISRHSRLVGKICAECGQPFKEGDSIITHGSHYARQRSKRRVYHEKCWESKYFGRAREGKLIYGLDLAPLAIILGQLICTDQNLHHPSLVISRAYILNF